MADGNSDDETSAGLSIRWHVPVVDWEVVGLRKFVPPTLAILFDLPTPIIRVSRSIDQKQRRRHSEDLGAYERLTETLREWKFARKQPLEEAAGSREERWQVVVFVQEGGEAIPLLVILEVRDDRVLYLRSVHRRQQQWGDGFGFRPGVVVRKDEG